MDACKTPIAMLADVSARKVDDTVSRLNPLTFDEYSDSPRTGRISESPFMNLARRLPENFFTASPQVGGFIEVVESPYVNNSIRKRMLESPQAPSLGRASAPLESPQFGDMKAMEDLDKAKASPGLAALMKAVTCSNQDKSKKKRQPPNPERKSEYRGVSWQKTSKAWVAQYKSGGKTTYLGLFGTEQEAARAYDVAVYLNGGKNLNFGTPSEEILKEYRNNGNIPAGRLGATASKKTVVEERNKPVSDTPSASAAAAAALAKADKGATSNYRGVSWYAARQIWKASIQVNRKKEYIGRFETEEEAARAYNKKASELRGRDAILNIVPDTVTRYPPGTVPLAPEQLAALEAKELERKEKKDKKRNASVALESSTFSSSSSASSATANDTDDDHKPKKLKAGNGERRSSSTIPPHAGADLARTPMLNRAGENESRNLGLPVKNPVFVPDEDEVGLAMRNVNPFDSPLFISPTPQTNLKRPFTATTGELIPFSIASTAHRMPVLNNGNFTPMLQNLFDSPFPGDAAGSFTPSTDLVMRVPDFGSSATTRKGRKALVVPFT